MDRGRIGVFDSGVGGLGVWRHIVRALPTAATVYWADQAHVPYGGKTAAALQSRAEAGVAVLRAHGATMVVVACNTATAVSLPALRRAHPDLAFVGMEPAVKPAAAASRTGVIGVLATRTTLDAPGFRALLDRHAGGVRVVTRAGVGLVEAVEAGETTGAHVERMIEACVAPMRSEGVDQLVLGCTHYPFLREVLERVVGPGVTLVDPAPAVARRVTQLWGASKTSERGALDDAPDPAHQMLTSAEPEAFARAVRRWVPRAVGVGFGFADHGAADAMSADRGPDS